MVGGYSTATEKEKEKLIQDIYHRNQKLPFGV